MPSPGVLRFFAIDTGDVHDPGQFRGDGLQSNTRRHSIPSRHHSFLGLGRLFANRAPRVVGCQLPEAFPVNSVTTGHFVRGTSRAKQKFLTNRTIGFILSTFAIVVVVKRPVDAHSAIVAVLKVFGATDSAKATIWAVIRLFIISHP